MKTRTLARVALEMAIVAIRRTRKMAKTLKDWQDLLDGLNSSTTAIAGRLDNLSQQVQNALKNQPTGLSDDDQNAIFTEFQAISDHLKSLGTDPNNPVPPPPPSAVPPVTSVDGASNFSDGSAPQTPQPTTGGVTPAGTSGPDAGPNIQATDGASHFTTGAAPQPPTPTPAPTDDGQNPVDGTAPTPTPTP